MKIVLVTPLLDLGGGQRYITTLANYLSKIGHDVTIICIRNGEIFYTISDKVTVIQLDYNYSGILSKIYSGLATMLNLRKKIKQIQPNFVLSILSTTNILTILATSYLGIKVFVEDVMSPLKKRSKIELLSRKLLYRKATGIIVLTNLAKEMLEKETGHSNVRVITNPVSEFNINKKIKKEKIIINVGRLNSLKGQKYFIEACAKIKDPEWKFIILGEGELREKLELQARHLGVSDQLHMPGAVKNVNDWLAKASIFAFPSISEALPIALIEAMNASLPCVSFNCVTGPSELIEDGLNGFLVPVGDIELFTERLKELMNNPSLRTQFSKGAKNIAENFSVEKISKEILEFCA